MSRVDDGSLARYADAIVRDGLQIGPGDVLAVHPEPIQREFAIALTEAGYRAGARYVDVLEVDPRIEAVTVWVRKLRPPVPQQLATSGVRLHRERAQG